jgi:hypothetical protein
MTDDIIRMAREADIDWHKHWNDDESNRLEVFAALVAAAEREACAKVCETFYNHEAKDCAEAIRARGQDAA